MKRLILIGCFFLASSAYALVDPLGSQFQPSYDQTASDYYVRLGTITVTDSLFKVFQSSVAPGTQHWIQVYLMQNEIQSFQVHVSPSVNVTSLTVTMSNLVDTQTVPSTIIYATNPDIQIYREWYLNIATPTALSTTTYMGGARAYMPDILIPAQEPYYGQTTNAFPLYVGSTETQSAWIDVHIPTNAPSGYYSGSVYVSSGSVVVSTMPVVFAVWSWLMPSTASLGTVGAGFGYNGFNIVAYNTNGVVGGGAYPNSGGGQDGAVTREWIDGARQMLDNRWSVAYPANIYPETGSFANYITNIGPLINGTSQYTVNTILPQSSLTKVQHNQIFFTPAEYQNYATNFNNQGWMPRLFEYLCDEPPNGCSYAQIISSGNASRTYSTPIIPNLVTVELARAQANHIDGQIDWITPLIENLDPTSGDLRSTYNSYLATSSGPVRQIGSYIDCESAGTCGNGTIGPANLTPYPNRHIDGTPVANRAMETFDFLDSLNYELYFAIDLCDNNNSCATPRYPGGGIDPWYGQYNFGTNGDGQLMTPSTSTIVTFTVSPSTPIWCPSMRLKYFRDGEQDYEYENYLTQQGQGTFVNAQIASWMTNGYTFNNSPAGLEAARLAMGNKIHQLTYPLAPFTSPSESWTGAITATGNIKAQ